MRKFVGLLGAAVLVGATLGIAHAGTPAWQQVKNQPPFFPGAALLLMNGDVMVQAQPDNASQWWLLEPNDLGSYLDGSWHQIASLPVIDGTQYAPEYYASAVLPDGKVLIMGGEYNGESGQVESNLGAIYDPVVTKKWTAVNAPVDPDGIPWRNIGDAGSVVLPNGTFMLQSIGEEQDAIEEALFDEENYTWKALLNTNKDEADQAEEGWTLLRDGTVLTVDIWNSDLKHTEKFYKGKWISAGDTTAQLDGGKNDDGSDAYEVGPAVLRADGTVIAFGATGTNSVYQPPSTPSQPGKWVKAPSFPTYQGSDGVQRLDVADGPAALMPNGSVLVAASPGVSNRPIRLYEFTPTGALSLLSEQPPNAANDSSFFGRMLVLPTGQILFIDGSQDVEIYTPSGSPNAAWAPTIGTYPSSIVRGANHSYKITGTQFNGLSQGAMFGDDAQMATNYPLVRVSYANGGIYYCRAFHPSTMAVATGNATVSTNFGCGTNVPAGAANLEVVANGIPSASVPVTLQ